MNTLKTLKNFIILVIFQIEYSIFTGQQIEYESYIQYIYLFRIAASFLKSFCLQEYTSEPSSSSNGGTAEEYEPNH